MLIFGDSADMDDPRGRLRRLESDLLAIPSLQQGWGRHDALVGALISAGMLAQAITDAEFEAQGEDDLTPLHASSLDLVAALARCVARSWRSRFAQSGPLPIEEVQRLREAQLPPRATFKLPEGFAVYGVSPEAYVRVASRIGWDRPPLVIGLRSIGVSLAAAAAAGAGARSVISLRPIGDPYLRQVRVSSAMKAKLRAHDGDFLIVDEGPGRSGSSFGAAGDMLEQLGVDERRLVFMPSHAGDIGNCGSVSHRERWRRVRRAPAPMDEILAEVPITAWFADVVGPALKCEDLSGGVWRKDLPLDARPPVWRLQERRKFRLATEQGVFVARFAGLGEIGLRKLNRARQLHESGFSPEPLALRGGFLLERWIEGEPLSKDPADRKGFLDLLGRYLGFRARQTPAPSSAGGTAQELATMTLVNAAAIGGECLRAAVCRALGPLSEHGAWRTVEIDGRLHAWEWRRDPQGRIWKTDALDHCCGHDLIGRQDIAWDLAGAAVEFSLSTTEMDQMRRVVDRETGLRVDPGDVRRLQLAYCAFQAGLWTYASEDPEEAEGAACRARLYADWLRRLAGAPST